MQGNHRLAALAALAAPGDEGGPGGGPGGGQGGGLTIAQRSQWYKSAPVPASDQPWFVNAVVRVRTALDPDQLIAVLLKTEESFGRRRIGKNAPRILHLEPLTATRPKPSCRIRACTNALLSCCRCGTWRRTGGTRF